MIRINKKIHKFNMVLDIDDGGISSVLNSVGIREKAFMGIIHNTVSPGMTCIDLGANIGYTTLFMLERLKGDGIVFAIEPDSHNLDLLKENVSLNNYDDICEITKCAISDKDGQIDFWIARHPNLNSVKKTKHSIRKEVIDAYSLETFLENRQYPNFIKMDVEGHEVKIFEGALNYFEKNKGTTNFLVEVHPHYYDIDNDFAKILKEYFRIGFNTKYVISTPIPQPSLFRDRGYAPFKSIATDGFYRGFYKDIKNEDLLDFACKENIEGNSKKIVRSFMLSREE